MEAFWDPERYLSFLPVFIRTSFFVLAIPVFSARFAPIVVRAGLSLAIALCVHSGIKISLSPPTTIADVIIGVVNELLLSFLIFLTIRIFFLGPQLSGEVIGFQIGYSLMTIVQPFEETHLSVISDLFFMIALMMFFVLDLHIAFFWGLKKSFELVPPFSTIALEHTKGIAMERLTESFATAVQISLPLIVILFILEISTAIISRSVPQFNVLVIGFPLKIIVGMLVLTFIFDRVSFAIAEFTKGFVETYSDILKAVR